MKLRTVKSQKLFKNQGGGLLVPLPSMMRKFAKIMLKSVVKEVKRDLALSRGLSSKKALLPDSERFIKSFYYEISGNNIEILSDWPTIKQHLEGREPFPMWWLVQPKRLSNKRKSRRQKVRKAKIVVGGSNTIVRSMPTIDKMWIHPGFMKYNFLERGVRKGRGLVMKLIESDPEIMKSIVMSAING